MASNELIWFTVFSAVFCLLLFYALFTARQESAALEKANGKLSEDLALQQQQAIAAREDATAWRTMTEKQNEEVHLQSATFLSRLDSLRQQSERKQIEIDLAKQMCRDLPTAQARVLELEKELAVERHHFSSLISALSSDSPAPATSAAVESVETLPAPIAFESPADTTISQQLEQTRSALDLSLRKNASLEQALTVARLKFRKLPPSKKARV